MSWSISEDENFVMILHDRVPVSRQIIQEFICLFVLFRFSDTPVWLNTLLSISSEGKTVEQNDENLHKIICRFSPLLKIGKSWASESSSLESQDHLQHAQFLTSKEGETGVIFVEDNDIYHIPSLNNR